MQRERKVKIYNALFMSVIIGVTFTIAGGIITTTKIDWDNFLAEAIVGILVGFIVSIAMPIEKWSTTVASKLAKPNTFLFKFIIYASLLVIMLLFMCPVLTLFIGCVIYGAPVIAVLPNLYSLFIPFFMIGVVIIPLISGYTMKISLICAGVSNTDINEEKNAEQLTLEDINVE